MQPGIENSGSVEIVRSQWLLEALFIARSIGIKIENEVG
jgi:hypothetical protein